MTTRTTSRTVTFSRPFTLSGIDGIQPAGTYTVETDEELIQELSFPAYRRIATLLLLPSHSGSTILAQIATIDPLELKAALERDAMTERGLVLETNLTDLLADEIIQRAVRSSGLTPNEFKEQWRDLAARLERLRPQ
jgi:hypothetical protein